MVFSKRQPLVFCTFLRHKGSRVIGSCIRLREEWCYFDIFYGKLPRKYASNIVLKERTLSYRSCLFMCLQLKLISSENNTLLIVHLRLCPSEVCTVNTHMRQMFITLNTKYMWTVFLNIRSHMLIYILILNIWIKFNETQHVFPFISLILLTTAGV